MTIREHDRGNGTGRFGRSLPALAGVLAALAGLWTACALGADSPISPAADPSRGRWSAERASGWYETAFPIRGFNYLPRTAVNSTEMWQRETFDPGTIDEELGWAARAGHDAARIFLPYIVWKADPEGLERRLDDLLAIAQKRRIRVVPIFFCDCAFAGREPYLGKQDDPVPGVHNSGWTPSPGLALVDDRSAWPELERYVVSIVRRFAEDRRILFWDLYNEPGNSSMGTRSLPLAEAAFAWARSAAPSQPLTIGAWVDFGSPMSRRLMALSDIVSFHGYDAPDGIRAKIALCERASADPGEAGGQTDGRGAARKTGGHRPVVCTEWLHRQSQNTFAAILPIFAERRVGWFHWGLVAGRTQTYLHWGSAPGSPAPAVWQHDLFRADGRAYDIDELDWVRGFPRGKEAGLLPTSEIWIRDPFVVPAPAERVYWMVGTSGFRGFHAWRSADLERWSGPLVLFRGGADFWADRDYWAPEIHEYRGRHYLLASFKAEGKRRGTQILAADRPSGPFSPWSDGPVTPAEWESLDGTLFVEGSGASDASGATGAAGAAGATGATGAAGAAGPSVPWMVFCHEWLQVTDGTMCAVRLADDLKRAVGEPQLLFRASDAPWVGEIRPDGSRVTDGPFLHRTEDGTLLLLWSSFSKGKYALGVARSESGKVLGPWAQEPEPLLSDDGGHGMLFRAFDGALTLAIHRPNSGGNERARFLRVRERGGRLVVEGER